MNFIPEIERLLSGERNKFSELFGLVDGLMLTGSYATKSSTRNSDIDIIVLSRNVNYLYTESVCYGEKYVQLIFFPYYKFQDIIIQDINRGKGVCVSMIRNGIIFKDIASKILTKTKRFVLNTVDEIRCEQLDYGLIHKITSGVDVIKNSSSLTEKIYCASELLLDISRLITCKYVADAKHLSRIITSQFPDLAIFNSYQQFIKTNDPSIYIQDIEEILMNFGGPQYTWTSSWVFTYPHDHHIMVFFPMQRGNDMHFSKYLEDISVIANDCHIYGFYIGKNQNMEEGYYLFIYTDEVPIERIYRKIENFIKIILSGLHRTVQISFPYKTLFYKGLQFGGIALFKRMLPYFTQIWRLFLQLYAKLPDGTQKNYSRIIATYYFYQLYDASDILQSGVSNFFKNMYDNLVLEAVDPNGLYNAVQMECMKEKTLDRYQYAYQQHSTTYKEIIASFNNDSQRILHDFKLIFREILDLLRNTSDDEILYPDIYPINNKKEILTLNISLHIMSIFQLSPQEQFGIIFNLLQYKNHDI